MQKKYWKIQKGRRTWIPSPAKFNPEILQVQPQGDLILNIFVKFELINIFHKKLKSDGQLFIGQIPEKKFEKEYYEAKDGGQKNYKKLSACTPPHSLHDPNFFHKTFDSKFKTIEIFYDRENRNIDASLWYAIEFNFGVLFRK